ncbi:DUF7144 family membrane protein [Micromonospora radicis]|uniref:DUF7144 domain-containing protein n=1 Tax=Micromonospora radicis TaxID=1894971 RepID=A0A418MU04_9ACTN|nr:hypothetical protein [Micromonospora radicis]RIV37622.1 hypothetical protein D2L64_15455 [Micromonospora radicis]
MTGGADRDRGLLLAGVLLGAAGIFDAVAGIGDLTAPRYVSVGAGVVQQHPITGWAWLHLVVGGFTTLAAALLPLRRRWSAGLALVAVVAFVAVHLFFLAYHPIQTVISLGLALAAARLVVRQRRAPPGIERAW